MISQFLMSSIGVPIQILGTVTYWKVSSKVLCPLKAFVHILLGKQIFGYWLLVDINIRSPISSKSDIYFNKLFFRFHLFLYYTGNGRYSKYLSCQTQTIDKFKDASICLSIKNYCVHMELFFYIGDSISIKRR